MFSYRLLFSLCSLSDTACVLGRGALVCSVGALWQRLGLQVSVTKATHTPVPGELDFPKHPGLCVSLISRASPGGW